jgi:hypothetical protein
MRRLGGLQGTSRFTRRKAIGKSIAQSIDSGSAQESNHSEC